MAQTAVIALDDVLARGEPSAGARPIEQGLALYACLNAAYRLALVTVFSDRDSVQNFLMAQGLNDHVVLLTGGSRRDQLIALRRQQHDLRLYVDANPQLCAFALQQGITVLHFAVPAYLRPEWRPDYDAPVRPWDSIAAETGQQQVMRSQEPAQAD